MAGAILQPLFLMIRVRDRLGHFTIHTSSDEGNSEGETEVAVNNSDLERPCLILSVF